MLTPDLQAYALFVGITIAVLLIAALVLTALNKSGNAGRRVCDLLSVAPVLDLVVFAFTHGPWIAGWIVWWRTTAHTPAGFFGYLGLAILAQVIALTIWAWVHEALHPSARRGPRIVHTLNRRVGWARNHLAVWWTALAVPIFTLVRVGELVIYPPLTWLVRLPKYRTQDWVNVSRQKFSHLVGWDLIWCLYCDWMTGVWSLGSEMLRNVESFWCPLRFNSPEKCANCAIDFPDVQSTWIAPPAPGEDGMAKVAKLLEDKYPGPSNTNAWHGHPIRLTVSAKPNHDKPASTRANH